MRPYSDLIKKLFEVNLFGGFKLGLTHTLLLSQALGNPEKSFDIIHIAGTNGKGSVSKKIASAYQHLGKRTGLYTSPHIACFRERIRLNEEMISEAAIERLLPSIFQKAEMLQISPTFFELTTLLALHYFAEEKAEVVVLETGLGGRLDATNIVTPRLSVITSISLEHTDILGTTLEEIAQEKAGIIKRGVPVLLGPRVPYRSIQPIATLLNSPIHQVEDQFFPFEAENRAIAKRALEILNLPPDSIEKGIQAKLSCRYEIFEFWRKEQVPLKVILDVAHNPDGLEQLFKVLRRDFPQIPLRILLGLSKTKDLWGCLKIVNLQGKYFHLVQASNGRGVSVEHLKESLASLGSSSEDIFTHESVTDAVHLACEAAIRNGEILVICGTFFIFGEVRAALGIEEPRDTFDMNERRVHT
jgi:dihydrofolate synthase/folylpolyglutamate synthase